MAGLSVKRNGQNRERDGHSEVGEKDSGDGGNEQSWASVLVVIKA